MEKPELFYTKICDRNLWKEKQILVAATAQACYMGCVQARPGIAIGDRKQAYLVVLYYVAGE